MNTETALRAFLLSSGVSGCSSNNTFVGGVRKAGQGIPHAAVFLREIGGPPPHEYMDQASATYRYIDVQVRVRSAINGYITGKAQADAIWLALQAPTAASIDSDVVRVVNLQSAPMYGAETDLEESEWFFHVRTERGG